jgi:integrase
MSVTKRNGVYYAQLSVPSELRDVIGKSNFRRSTNVRADGANKAEAMAVAAPWLQEWHQLIRLARSEPDVVRDRMAVMKTQAAVGCERVELAGERGRHKYSVVALDKPEDAGRLGSDTLAEPGQSPGLHWSGKGPLLIQFLDRFIADRYENKRTAGEARRYIREASEFCPRLGDINLENARAWIRAEGSKPEEERRAVKTMHKATGFMSEYILWLQDQRLLVDSVGNPFRGLRFPTSLKKKQSYLPLSLEEVLAVREAAISKGDEELVAFIDVGRFTGMRLAEIGALSADSIETVDGIQCLRVKLDAKTKKSAGRLVPIARGLRSLMPLTNFDFERRENAVGKRFGRLKSEVLPDGKDRRKCFHSIRKFVTTVLEQAGIPEGVAADLVGHEKQTITYGVYSGGSALTQIAQAVAVLDDKQPVSSMEKVLPLNGRKQI